MPVDAIDRPNVDAVLARRWERRLLTVVAGAGFGKTVALARALALADVTPKATVGRDCWLSCEPADSSAAHLIRGLAAACGVDAGDLRSLTDQLWSEAPTPICIVLDDLHEIADGSEGIEVVRGLITESPANVHVVLATRGPLPLPTGRLAASGQLLRVDEHDLVLTPDELDAIAARQGLAPEVLASTGGWPALVELTASAGSDVVLDYLWEEVLGQVGDRAASLARFCVVGGGGDEIASAVAGRTCRVDDLVAGVPLVERSPGGEAVLHPLWLPPLRRLLSDTEAAEAMVAAAGVHRDAARFGQAIELLAAAEAWDEALALIRHVSITPGSAMSSAEFGRWHRLLPSRRRSHPAALLARGYELLPTSMGEAVGVLRDAEKTFAEADDADGEVVAIAAHGVVAWLANDIADLWALHLRTTELASRGSVLAAGLERIGVAAIAHLGGDSGGVLDALREVDPRALPTWAPIVTWLQTVAHRRNGDLDRALQVVADAATDEWSPLHDENFRHAELRVAWLAGDVERVVASLPALRERYVETGDAFNAAGAAVELATKQAWLGNLDEARALVAELAHVGVEADESPMVATMRAVALASLAIADGDEARAAEALVGPATATIGRPDGWYWRDRGAVALVHVLVPATRDAWAHEPLGPPHRIGVVLAEALEAVREGDLGAVSSLQWPTVGQIRSNLPVPWIAELVAAADAAGVEVPGGLVDAVGPVLRDALARQGESAVPKVSAAARKLSPTIAATPAHRVAIDVLGPVEIRRDGVASEDPELRRRRVRELLCLLVVEGKARREVIAEQLWPDLDDGARNLRVTLSYLQRVLQPERTRREPPFFVRSDGTWLWLHPSEALAVDLWRFDELIDQAQAADDAGRPADAVAAYLDALPLCNGEPLSDAAYSDWAEPHRTRIVARYTRSAVRAAELLLAAGRAPAACIAAEHAIAVDRYAEAAYDVLARSHTAAGDPAAAARTIDESRSVMGDLGLEPTLARPIPG